MRPSGVGKAGPHGPRCRVTTSSSSATTIPSCYQDFKLQSFKLHPSSENSAVCHAAFAAQFITAETRPRRRSRVRQRDGLRCVRRRSGVIPALRTLTEEGMAVRGPSDALSNNTIRRVYRILPATSPALLCVCGRTEAKIRDFGRSGRFTNALGRRWRRAGLGGVGYTRVNVGFHC